MRRLGRAALLFLELSVLVFAAAWTGDLIFGLVRDVRPFGFNMAYEIVLAGMVAVVLLVGWRLLNETDPPK